MQQNCTWSYGFLIHTKLCTILFSQSDIAYSWAICLTFCITFLTNWIFLDNLTHFHLQLGSRIGPLVFEALHSHLSTMDKDHLKNPVREKKLSLGLNPNNRTWPNICVTSQLRTSSKHSVSNRIITIVFWHKLRQLNLSYKKSDDSDKQSCVESSYVSLTLYMRVGAKTVRNGQWWNMSAHFAFMGKNY